MSTEFKGIRCSSVATPIIPVGHPRYVWRPAADTDVQRTWRSYGWKPEADRTASIRSAAARMRQVRP